MSIKISEAPYKERIGKGIDNDFMRQAVSSAQGRFRNGRTTQAEELGNWEDWRQLGEEIRSHTLENIDYYLYQLSEEVEKRGGNVFFAETAEKANAYIENVVKKKNAKKL